MQSPELRTLEDWEPVVCYQDAFTAEECDRILDLFTDFKAGKAAGKVDTKVRDSLIQPVYPNADSQWLFDKTAQQIKALNQKHYRSELAGFTEPFQLTCYREGQFYNWHLDIGKRRNSIRKLSFIVQLKDESDYDGGDVEIQVGHSPMTLPKPRGSLALFPSYVLHRVTTVTRGERMSLVGWIGGHHYR